MGNQTEQARWQQVKELLAAALDLPAAERAAFLDQACGSDTSLRSDVESLIVYQADAESFIETPAISLEPAALQGNPPSDQFSVSMAGHHIGPYQIQRELGRGGMGAVYLATRADDQYRKQVAIKLIRRGMDSEFVLRRFRNERQILAALDHPNIARLLDGGTTGDGLPYLVMEYIEGVPIHEYCDAHKLNSEQRLHLFQCVCAAVQYAHQRLVIHRDIKPNNILVTHDGVPKLLDFGIAKILTPELAAHTLDVTEPALRLMTPRYASPEQIRGEPVTTTSDVYSLGVVLYELLTGSSPYKPTSESVPDLMQAVCESEPEKPSTAVARDSWLVARGSTDQMRVTSHESRVTKKLRQQLLGDLDNIVLMALRKEPARRYASVEQLSEDIRRHLVGLPVIARPATMGYRVGKFIQRHKAGVVAAALILLTLISGLIGINQQRAIAVRRFNDVRKLAHSVVFDYHDAIADLPGSTPVRQRLVNDALEYLDSLANEAGDDQTLQQELAAAYIKIGDVQGNPMMANLGDMDGAVASYRKSLVIRQALTSADPARADMQRELAENHERMGDVLSQTGQIAQSYESYHQAMNILEKLTAAAPGDVELRRQLATVYDRIGQVKGDPFQANLGDTSGGLEYQRKALAMRDALSAADPANTTLRFDLQRSHKSMTDLLLAVRDFPQAEHHANQALTIAQALAAADPTSAKTGRALSNAYEGLGRVMEKKGDLEKALMYYRQQLANDQSRVNADPTNAQARTDLAVGHTHIGDLLFEKGELSQALEHYRRVLSIDQAIATADPTNAAARRAMAIDYQNIGLTQVEAGDITGALQSHRQMVTIFNEVAQNDPNNMQAMIDLAMAQEMLGRTFVKAGDLSAALERYRQGVPIGERVLMRDPANRRARRALAVRYSKIGDVLIDLANDPKSAVHHRAERLREARQAYQRCLDLFLELRQAAANPAEYDRLTAQVTRTIAQCDEELATLQGKR